MNSRFSGSSGFGSWFGNEPSGSKKQRTASIGRRSRTGGSITPAIPFAASITTRSGLTASTSMNDSTRSTNAGQMSSFWTCPGPRRLVAGSRPWRASRMSRSPESPPTGSAPRRTIFIPVYSFGLCEAVTAIPPSSPSSPTAK